MKELSRFSVWGALGYTFGHGSLALVWPCDPRCGVGALLRLFAPLGRAKHGRPTPQHPTMAGAMPPLRPLATAHPLQPRRAAALVQMRRVPTQMGGR